MRLKVMTYNTQSGRSNDAVSVRNFDNIVRVLQEADADIVGLQEVGKHPTAGFPEYIMEGEPTEYIAEKLHANSYFAQAEFFYGKYPYGNSLITKYPIKSAKTVLIPDAKRTEDNEYYQTRSILVAEIDVCGGITVLVSHFGLMPEEKRLAVETALGLLREIKTPVLLMGDLNMLADDETLAPLFTVLQDTANGQKEPFTWPSNMEKEVGEYEAKIKEITHQAQAGRKIDYIFASSEFKVEGIEVIKTRASDHMPYVVDFTLQK